MMEYAISLFKDIEETIALSKHSGKISLVSGIENCANKLAQHFTTKARSLIDPFTMRSGQWVI
jgi:hypothetical protein